MHGHGQVHAADPRLHPEEDVDQSEKKMPLPDGGCVCMYTVAGTVEIKKWIYSWLPYAEVLEPDWFRNRVQKDLSAALKHHARSRRPSTKS